MNSQTNGGMNLRERERLRCNLADSRVELRRGKIAAEDDDQRTEFDARLEANELELARVNEIALEDRDDDPSVVELIGELENGVNELKDEVDAFERAADKAQKLADVIAVADSVLGAAGRLITLVV